MRFLPIISIKNKRPGFTLIEVLIYVALFSVLMGGLAAFLTVLNNTRINSQTMAEIEQQGQFLTQTITQILRNAVSVNQPATNGSGAVLSLNTDLASTTPTVFALNAGVLTITEGASPALALSNGKVVVSNLTFQDFSLSGAPASVRVSLTLQSSANLSRPGSNYGKTFYAAGSLKK